MSRRIELTEGVQNIEGFAEGDKVVITKQHQAASFTVASDPTTLEITQIDAGKVAVVRLVGALPRDAGIVLDQRTAEKAIGFSFIEEAE